MEFAFKADESLPALDQDELNKIYDQERERTNQRIQRLRTEKKMAEKAVITPASMKLAVNKAIFKVQMEEAEKKDAMAKAAKEKKRKESNIKVLTGSLGLPTPKKPPSSASASTTASVPTGNGASRMAGIKPVNPFIPRSYAAAATASSTPARKTTEPMEVDLSKVKCEDAQNCWHVHAVSDVHEFVHFSHSAFIDLRTRFSDNIGEIVLGKTSQGDLPKEAASHSMEYIWKDRMAILRPYDPKFLDLYKAVLESTSTENEGVTRFFLARKPPSNRDVSNLPAIPKTEKILLRLHEIVGKNCSNFDIINYIQAKYMNLNGIGPSDWRVLEHEDAETPQDKWALYPSAKYGMAHLVAIEVKKNLYDLITKERKQEATKLNTTEKDFKLNRVPWFIHGVGEPLVCEPATFNANDGTYLPNDMQVENMRIKVTETQDVTEAVEDDEGNLTFKEVPVRSRAYTDRLFSNKRNAKGKFAESARKEDDEESDSDTEYEAHLTVPKPTGSIKAIKLQTALNQLQTAFAIRSIRTQVTKCTNPSCTSTNCYSPCSRFIGPEAQALGRRPEGVQARRQDEQGQAHQAGGQRQARQARQDRQGRQAHQARQAHQGRQQEGERLGRGGPKGKQTKEKMKCDLRLNCDLYFNRKFDIHCGNLINTRNFKSKASSRFQYAYRTLNQAHFARYPPHSSHLPRSTNGRKLTRNLRFRALHTQKELFMSSSSTIALPKANPHVYKGGLEFLISQLPVPKPRALNTIKGKSTKKASVGRKCINLRKEIICSNPLKLSTESPELFFLRQF